MADYQEESDSSDEIEDDGYQDSGEMSPSEGSDFMPPLERLHQYSISENNFNRQMVGRSVVETLRMVHDAADDVDRVMAIVAKIAHDSEPAVRGEMMEHLPHVVMVCHELGLPRLPAVVDALLPLVVATITDADNQVRKTAQTALLVLMEQNLIAQQYIEQQLCPEINNRVRRLANFDVFEDYHPSIVALMSKMAPLLGCEVTEQQFVPMFTMLCSCETVVIRKTCAMNFGDFCAVVSRNVTETQLLPRFVKLARDSEWGVRKACAEVIMSVSCACCLATRKNVLAPLFSALLNDAFRWVRASAFQTLGPFITTFAEPSITGLAYNQQGELVLTNPEGFEFRLLAQKTPLNDFFEELASKKEPYFVRDDGEYQNSDSGIGVMSQANSGSREVDEFNSFLFWREPLPDVVPLTIHSENEVSSSNQTTEDSLSDLHTTCQQEGLYRKITDKEYRIFSQSSWSSSPLCSNVPSLRDQSSDEPTQSQDIVPQPLIDSFVSMCDSDNGLQTDVDLAHHCAFSLPAVALTLGAEHWPLLRDTYATLAADRQWKVRRTVASSIHELAVIVGEDVATRDLVPIFSGLIKDLDEVRIGALRHLNHFLRLLRPSGRAHFLPRLGDFLKTEYDYNWRFREELAAQLLEALTLYGAADCCSHLSPVAVGLLLDHVAAVRQTALYLVCKLVTHVSVDVCSLRGLLAELAEQLAHSARWGRRQTFALLCARLAAERALADDLFARDLLPHLLDLTWDPVPNVRLAVARTLAADIMDNQYFCNEQNPHNEVLVQAIKRLQSDKDRDVRYFASLKPKRASALPEEFHLMKISSSSRLTRLGLQE